MINSARQVSTPERRHTVVMGRSDFFSVLLRLIGVELYKLRQRLMSKVLIALAVLIILCVPVTIALIAFMMTNGNVPAEQVARFSEGLRLPQSFTIPNYRLIANYLGLIIVSILGGTMVGGEYSVGTIRLVLTRGPSRTQFLLAKFGALLAIIISGTLILTIINILVGALLNLTTGVPLDFHFFTGEWLLHALYFMLETWLGLFVYAALAVFLATLGKNTAAGVAGGLVWWVVEGLLSTIFLFIGTLNRGAPGDFLRAIPNYFIGNNISSLLANQDHFLTGGDVGNLGDLHSILVLLIYALVLTGLTWWITEQRDMTN